MDLKINMKPTSQLISERGLCEGGITQKYIDQECIRRMRPYTPFLSGALIKSATIGTVIGSGTIKQNTPYARYQYYGEVYGPNIPIIKGGVLEGFYSPPKKSPTGRDLQYNKSKNPKAGKMWFERMKADHKTSILAGAAKTSGGTYK